MPARKRSTRPKPGGRKKPVRDGFVGRDPSPVLDRYPPKDPKLAPRGPPASTPPPRASPTSPAAAPAPGPTPSTPVPLISLERPFDVDEFSSLLGETSIRITVPLDHLAEVIRRVVDFMGFGIYVYSVSVRPAPSELLKAFVVELHRVDYSPEAKGWIEFVEKGTSDSPFGPSGTRT
jgi:hypothetical protein